ncbi:hypothetical protein [Anaerocolumna sp. MB42-C2]|uniref:hypothetical protein n=1 Tax=Anaerocolumna sp. MB42-C2 TaxID=3070997 RepID=UPI0027E0ABC0|nr:hypothetical protein [Anaerocolumna sp. MB42-C2]WMJ86370.1 hypothetical protein RBU59_20330 [Anaerocolumna sp. MB42-C2]
MSKNIKLKLALTAAVIMVLTFSTYMYVTMAESVANEQKEDSFSSLLSDNNITVIGTDAEMTRLQFVGLTNRLKKDNISVISKYDKILDESEDAIVLTPEQLLELDYYSKSVEEQNIFLSKAANQNVDVSSKDGVYLISYNVYDK